MKGKFMIIAALLGALTFGACVDSTESASVTAIRNAKAEQLKSLATLNNAKAQAEATIAAAEAQLAAAQAQLLAAEAAALNAATEEQKIKNQIAAAKAAQKIAEIEAAMELAAIEYQMELLEAQLAFNESLKDLADNEAKALEAAYDAYTDALAALADAKDNLAKKEKAIADEKAKLAKVDTLEEAIDAVNKNISDQTAKVNKVKAKIAAKEAAIAKLEVIGHSSTQLKDVEIPAAEKALQTAINNEYYTFGAKTLADKAVTAFATNQAKELYGYIKDNYPWTLDGTDVDVLDEFEDEDGTNKDSWAFYLTEMNDDGVYEQGDDEKTAVVLFDNAISVNVYDEEDINKITPIYKQRVLYYGIHSDAVKTYEAELAKLLSTSDEAIELAEAEAHLEARTEVEQYEDLQKLYDNYIEDVTDVNAKIAKKQAEIYSLTYQKNILDAADYDDYYEKNIEDIDEKIEKLEGEIEDLEENLEELEDKFEEELDEEFDRTGISSAEAGLAAYKRASDAVIAAQKAYDQLAADYAEEVAYLNYMVSLSDAWTATYVTAYNAAIVAAYEANVAYVEAGKAKAKAAGVLENLETLWDELADAEANTDKDIVKEMLDTLYAELAVLKDCSTAGTDKLKGLKQEEATLKGYTDTLAALQNEDADKAAAALAAYCKTMTDNIAEWESVDLPDLQLQVAIAEANVVSYKAALDALLAE